MRVKVFYSAKAGRVWRQGTTWSKYSWDPQEYHPPFERKTKAQSWAVPFGKDPHRICACHRWLLRPARWIIYTTNRDRAKNLFAPPIYFAGCAFCLYPKRPLPSTSCLLLRQGLPNAPVRADSTGHSFLGDSLARQWSYVGQDGVVSGFFRGCLRYGKSSLKQLLPRLPSGCCDLLFLCNRSFISLLPHAQFPTAALKTC